MPDSKLDVTPLDLCDIGSITHFPQSFQKKFGQLDIPLNNAGVVNLESLQRTKAGWEMHMATNHLGHFALTGLLMPALESADAPRVVTVSSLAQGQGVIDFDDFDWRSRPYHRVKAYGDSKLANLFFSTELQRRFERAGMNAVSVAAHPALTGTERQQTIGVGGRLTKWLASPVHKGCRPHLMAATCESVTPGGYYGPRFGIGGSVRELALPAAVLDEALASELWGYSEELTGVSYL